MHPRLERVLPVVTLANIASALRIPWERDDQGYRRVGTWQQSYAGGKIWPLDPRPEEFSFDDWVIGTSRECRFGRMSLDFYSVSEHELLVSIYVERLAREQGWPEDMVIAAAREALTHDKSEAITGDMIRPLKHQPVMRSFRKVEDRLQRCAFAFFGVTPTPQTTALVKLVDRRVLVDEIEALMYDPSMYLERYGDVEGFDAEIAAMSWEHAAAAWVQRYCELWPEHLQVAQRAAVATVAP